MIERTIVFGDAPGLVGTVCLPEGARGAVGQILFNAGVVHRVGPHRINVRLARRLAARGIPSIRFDLAGLGDSPRAPGGRDFEQQAMVDLRSAMDALGREAGVERFSLLGYCSGGPHSYSTAKADPRVAGVILYDTYIYPTLHTRLNRYLLSIQRQGFASAVRSWVTRAFARGNGASPREPDASAISFRVPTVKELADGLHGLNRRGVSVAVMYSGSFRELYNYDRQFEDVFGPHGVSAFVSCDYFPAMDHGATELGAQAEFMGRIERWVLALDERCRGAKG